MGVYQWSHPDPALPSFHYYPTPLKSIPIHSAQTSLEWISNLAKLFSSVAHLLLDYSFCFSSRSLLNLSSGYCWGVEATIGVSQGTSALSWLIPPSEKVTSGLADSEGLISAAKDGKGSILWGGSRSKSLLRVRDSFLRWDKALRIQGFSFQLQLGPPTHSHPKLQDPFLYQLMLFL